MFSFSKFIWLGPVLLLFSSLLFSHSVQGEISVGRLTKEKAQQKYGITMHSRPNGDAGIKVWLEFKKTGILEHFTYAELQIVNDEGEPVLNAQLSANPSHHRRPSETTAVAFSAAPAQLAKCQFMVVCYGSSEGDVGYILPVRDFLDLQQPGIKRE